MGSPQKCPVSLVFAPGGPSWFYYRPSVPSQRVHRPRPSGVLSLAFLDHAQCFRVSTSPCSSRVVLTDLFSSRRRAEAPSSPYRALRFFNLVRHCRLGFGFFIEFLAVYFYLLKSSCRFFFLKGRMEFVLASSPFAGSIKFPKQFLPHCEPCLGVFTRLRGGYEFGSRVLSFLVNLGFLIYSSSFLTPSGFTGTFPTTSPFFFRESHVFWCGIVFHVFVGPSADVDARAANTAHLRTFITVSPPDDRCPRFI